MPIGSRGSPVFIAGVGGPPLITGFAIPFLQPSRYVISGITRDSTGAALGGCTVEIYETVDAQETKGRLRATTVSDANGVYSVEITRPASGLTFNADAYLAGAPDVAGTTVNTLVGI